MTDTRQKKKRKNAFKRFKTKLKKMHLEVMKN